MSRIVLGLTGKKQSGKDTAAKVLHDEFMFIHLSFAEVLKNVVGDLFYGLNYEHLFGDKKEDFIEQYQTTPRKLMQDIGLVLREYDSHIWVRPVEDLITSNLNRNIVISDVRFDNEATMIRKHGGQIWQVYRPDLTSCDMHISEQGLHSLPEYTLWNIGSIEGYKNGVRHEINYLLEEENGR